MNIFIIPGEESHLSSISKYVNDEICGILLHQRTDKHKIVLSPRLLKFCERIFTINSLLETATDPLDKQDQVIYLCLLEYIFSDTRVHYLATRSYFNSPFNNAAIIEKILVNSISIIRKTNPSCLVSSSTPHSLEAWVFAKCFEYMNLPIYILECTPIAFRSWLYRGLDGQEVVLRKGGSAEKELSPKSAKLLRDQRESESGAKDEKGFHVSRIYMDSVIGAESNRWWSWRRELSWLVSGKVRSAPLRLLSIYVKRQLHLSYRRVAEIKIPDGPFIIFFMHYQPERTSLPEGLIFVQQWIAVRMLSWCLPEGWTLLVREHPAMWFHPLDISVRNMSLFDDIASLRRTKICSMDVDTFELIDKCQATATLTGSVGFQSLLRGKPVIAFGVASYKDHPGCFSVRSYQDLTAALSAIKSDSLSHHFTDDAIRDYLLWIEQNSYSADSEEADWIIARLKNFSEMYRRLLNGNLELA